MVELLGNNSEGMGQGGTGGGVTESQPQHSALITQSHIAT